MIIAPILPKIGIELQTSKEQLGYLVTVYAVMLGIYTFLVGSLSDNIGRRKITFWKLFYVFIFINT